MKDEANKRLYTGYDEHLKVYAIGSWPAQLAWGSPDVKPVGMWMSGSNGYLLAKSATGNAHTVWTLSLTGDASTLVEKGDAGLVAAQTHTCTTDDFTYFVTDKCEVFVAAGRSVSRKGTIPLPSCSHVACTSDAIVVCGARACYTFDPVANGPGPQLYNAGAGASVIGLAAVTSETPGRPTIAVLKGGPNTTVTRVENGVQWSFPVDSSGQHTSATTVAFDKQSNVAFTFVQRESRVPTVVSKVLLEQQQGGWYGSLRLNQLLLKSGSTVPEALTTTLIDDERRVLWATGSHGMGLTAFTLHEAVTLDPSYADERGGTVVRVHGRGYGNSSAMPRQCRFAEGAVEKDAVFENPSLVVCETDAIARPDCQGADVTVALDKRYTAGTATLVRYAPPTVTAVAPTRGASWVAQKLRVTGVGFKASPSVTCVFHSVPPSAGSGVGDKVRLWQGRSVGNLNAAFVTCVNASCAYSARTYVNALHVPAVVVDSTTIECMQPEIRSAPLNLSYVDVALDGQIYTGNPFPHNVLRPAVGITTPDEFHVRIDNAKPVSIAVIDATRRPLGWLDDEPRTGYACVVSESEDTCQFQFNFTTVDGHAVSPPAASWPIIPELRSKETRQFSMKFVTDAEAWRSVTVVMIGPGEAHHLEFIDPPPTSVVYGKVVNPIRVKVVDKSGYVVSSLSNSVMRGSVLPGNETTTSKELEFYSSTKLGISQFRDAELKIRALVTYSFSFTLQGYPKVPPLVFTPMSAADCDSERHLVAGEVGCFPCPKEGVVCNGTAVLMALPGFWSPTGGGNKVYRCRSEEVCLGTVRGAAETQQCLEGSGGALCQGCAAGWGRQRALNRPCTKCHGVLDIVVTLFVGGSFCVFGIFVIMMTVRTYLKHGRLGDNMVLLRNGIVFLQILGKFAEYNINLPEPLNTTYYWFAKVSLFDFSLYHHYNCIVRTYFPLLEIYLLFPVTSFIIAAIVYLIVKYLWPSNKSKDATDQDRGVWKGFDELEERRTVTFKFMAGVSLSASFFLCYTTMLTHFLAYQKCNTYDDGTGTQMQKLWVDVSIDCEGDEYLRRKYVATVAAYIVGVFFPVLFLILYIPLRNKGDANWLVYVVGGYKKQLWFWPVIVLFRSASTIAPALFATEWEDKKIQIYGAIWGQELVLILQYYFQPFELPRHNVLEMLCLSVTCVVFNASVLYHVKGVTRTWELLLTHFLNIFSWLMLFIIIYSLLPSATRQRIKQRVAARLEKKAPPVEESDVSSDSDNDVRGQWCLQNMEVAQLVTHIQPPSNPSMSERPDTPSLLNTSGLPPRQLSTNSSSLALSKNQDPFAKKPGAGGGGGGQMPAIGNIVVPGPSAQGSLSPLASPWRQGRARSRSAAEIRSEPPTGLR